MEPLDMKKVVEKLLSDTKSGTRPLFSLDLSSATDRFPVSLQENLLAEMIGPRAAVA
jgi:hypothetical protein